MQIKSIVYLLLLFGSSAHVFGADRGEEIRNEMWVTPDKSFKVVETPKKWNDKSAVIIAQLNRFEYRKPVMRNLLRYNEYSHYRIKLNDKNAITKFAEITFLSDRKDNSEGEYIRVYTGFKIIKPGGKEIIVDPSKAVKMEREYRGRVQSYNKLAIPNLEPGDILDYYICEETTRANANLIHFFDPVIYSLPQEYPVINHKLQFRAERKCYINLRSLNGAPELKLIADEANDETFYTLEGTDMEGMDNVRWVFPYRELPTIKFRAAYASAKAMSTYDVLLGEPGKVKNTVTKKEVQDMVSTMLATVYDVKFLTKYAKKKLKNVRDPFELATKSYYYYRNQIFNDMESNLVEGKSPWTSMPQIKFVDVFSTFLASRKIPHDIVLGVPRNLSSLDDLLIENEISWLIRVKKGNDFMYFQPFDLNSLPGTLDPMLEGTEAYAIDGLVSPKKWDLKRITLPATQSTDNTTETEIQIDLSSFDKTNLSLKRTLKGGNKVPDQYNYMDPFDLRAEEGEKFEMTESSNAYLGKKKYQAMKDAYLAKRIKDRDDQLKTDLESNYNLKITEVKNYKVDQTGRYESAPALVYRLDFTSDNLVYKAGPNYMLDVGKLIEQQTKVESHEVSRSNNIYYENPRSFRHTIEFAIPKGYQVQGLDKLNQKTENKFGGFTCVAREVDGKVVIETNKHYDVNYAPGTEWKQIVSFLNAAHNFNEQKLLLKKK
ncbi:MAG: DUF3857 domain-containing protein [Chryseosolibacter sp.]